MVTDTVRLALSPKDLYRLRQTALSAQRAQIRAEFARQSLRELVLSLEHRYKLLGRNGSLDVHTGVITLDTDRTGVIPRDGSSLQEVYSGLDADA